MDPPPSIDNDNVYVAFTEFSIDFACLPEKPIRTIVNVSTPVHGELNWTVDQDFCVSTGGIIMHKRRITFGLKSYDLPSPSLPTGQGSERFSLENGQPPLFGFSL